MSHLSLERRVGRLTFQNPLVLGAGTCKTEADVDYALNTEVAGLEIGTITPLPRAGNSGSNFYAHYDQGVLIYTLNSLGMPNPGRDAVSTWASAPIRKAHDKGKLIGINITADSTEDIAVMVVWALTFGFDWITINIGCPNKWKEIAGTLIPETVLSFDLAGIADLTHQLNKHVGTSDTEIWLKLSPENDTVRKQSDVLVCVEACPTITGLVFNNTVPHCFAFDPGVPLDAASAIVAGGGYAGMGGPAVKPKALGDVRRASLSHTNRFNFIGAGGVTHGQDILDYLESGAGIVQFTSAWWANEFDKNVPGVMLADLCELTGIEFA